MRCENYRGVVRQGVVVLDDTPPIPESTPVVVTAVPSERGTSRAVLAAIGVPPHVSADALDELDRAIETGKRPLAQLDPFDTEDRKDSTAVGHPPA